LARAAGVWGRKQRGANPAAAPVSCEIETSRRHAKIKNLVTTRDECARVVVATGNVCNGFAMNFRSGLAAAILGLCVSAMPLAAATITVTAFDADVFAADIAAGRFIGSNFEREGTIHGEREVGSSLTTGVGTFHSLGGTGTGGTVRGLAGNTGRELALRDGNTYGRRDVLGGQWYLDSNDTYGIGWSVTANRLFDTVTFILIDGSDSGGYLRISVDGVSHEQRSSARLANGNAQLVSIRFDDRVPSALIELENFDQSGTRRRLNDGFAIDGAQVGSYTAVPLAPAGLFLIGGLLAMGAIRRRAGK